MSEVQEAMVAEAQDELGGLPLVEKALQCCRPSHPDDRLSGQLFTE